MNFAEWFLSALVAFFLGAVLSAAAVRDIVLDGNCDLCHKDLTQTIKDLTQTINVRFMNNNYCTDCYPIAYERTKANVETAK